MFPFASFSGPSNIVLKVSLSGEHVWRGWGELDVPTLSRGTEGRIVECHCGVKREVVVQVQTTTSRWSQVPWCGISNGGHPMKINFL